MTRFDKEFFAQRHAQHERVLNAHEFVEATLQVLPPMRLLDREDYMADYGDPGGESESLYLFVAKLAFKILLPLLGSISGAPQESWYGPRFPILPEAEVEQAALLDAALSRVEVLASIDDPYPRNVLDVELFEAVLERDPLIDTEFARRCGPNTLREMRRYLGPRMPAQ